jgi:hypothetical protein
MVYIRNVTICKVVNLYRRSCAHVSECCSTVDTINLLANMISPELVAGNALFVTQRTELHVLCTRSVSREAIIALIIQYNFILSCRCVGERGNVVVKSLCFSRKIAGSRPDEVN